MAKTNRIYKNKDYEESKKHIARKNEIITNRLLILFGIAVVLVACFVYYMNMSNYDMSRLHTISFVCIFITGALLVLSVILMIQRYRDDVDESDMTLHSKNVFAAVSLIFLANLVIYFTYQKWIPFLTAFTIALTIVLYIYYLYQREFFIFSMFSAIGCFLVYFGKTPSLASVYEMVFKIALSGFAVFVLIFALTVDKNKGYFLGVNILEKNIKYLPFYLLSAILAVSAAIAFQTFIDINFFYLIVANLIYFIVVGIYYTVKMI